MGIQRCKEQMNTHVRKEKFTNNGLNDNNMHNDGAKKKFIKCEQRSFSYFIITIATTKIKKNIK